METTLQTPDMFGLSGHGMRLRTIRGYDFGEVSSAMQKAIRRGETQYAGYWALELWASGFGNYVWKRLLTVSAEDCWGIITQEVKALHDSYAMINANLSGRRARGRIFISKAVILLCAAKTLLMRASKSMSRVARRTGARQATSMSAPFRMKSWA